MSKYIIAPRGYDEPDRIEGNEPDSKFARWLVLGMAAFWIAVILGIGLLYSCSAKADMQVYLEGEEDLGNGFKLCHYSEGVTITVAAHRLCPLSISIPN